MTINPNSTLGTFYGVGVGPGISGMIPVAALQALQTCEVIVYPRATSQETSAALWCLRGLELPKAEFQEVAFKMDPDRNVLRQHYLELAQELAELLKQQKNVGYLTLGDALTYSTYGYTIAALQDVLPDVPHKTFPGITSYASVAAALNWPLGEGKERTLILPCPDDMEYLRRDIETHDIVVLMKIGKRLPQVLALLHSMGIAQHCVFARRLGFEEERLCADVSQLSAEADSGYLSTMLIRRAPREKRHS